MQHALQFRQAPNCCAMRGHNARVPLAPSNVATPSMTSRAPRLAPAPIHAAAGSVEEGERSDTRNEGDYVEEFEGFRERDGGYTPFEFIEFTELPLKHEVSLWVDRPVTDCYKVWDNRLNWMHWFDMIDEVGFHEEEPGYVSMYLWYQWATTPFLELYVTLDRTQEEVNKYILEEPVEGMPLVAAVLFQEGSAEDEGKTLVTLRISYLLPKVLYEFAGQLAVYGDVDKKLQRSMAQMKAFVEGIDIDELEAANKQNDEQIRANFSIQRKQKEELTVKKEARIAEWEIAVAKADAEALQGTSSEDEAGGAEALSSDDTRQTVHRYDPDDSNDMLNPAALPKKSRRNRKASAAE